MAWTAPKTWVVGEPMTAQDLNVHLRDNLLALKAPPTALVKLDEAADYTTTSTVFVAVDNTRLNLSLTTTGGDVLIGFFANTYNASYISYLDIEFDGVMMGGDDGLSRVQSGYVFTCLSLLKTGVSVGTHSIRVMWRDSNAGGATTMFAGVTAGSNVHPYFWAREV